jgi:signal peptidase I
MRLPHFGQRPYALWRRPGQGCAGTYRACRPQNYVCGQGLAASTRPNCAVFGAFAPRTRLDGAALPNHGTCVTQTTPHTQPEAQPASASQQPPREENIFAFLAKLIIVVLVLRIFIFAPFSIPSESMLPGLVNGDYLVAAKWPYGFSRYSVPYGLPIIPGRVLASQPHRGDVVIFKAPPTNKEDWIKRVIGLPGDAIQMKGGVLYINGVAVPKTRIEDFEIAISPNTSCYRPVFEARNAAGQPVCHYPQFNEVLPGDNGRPAKTIRVLDLGEFEQDNTGVFIVPEGKLFLMGDNRDNSADSRFSYERGGIEFVPQENLVGRASIMIWSTDGSANWFLPWTWVTALRGHRIGKLL